MQLLLGLGGNLGDPLQAFRTALAALAERHQVLAVSKIMRSEPEGPPQPRYWNQAALLELSVPPLQLLDECQALEHAAGRRRDPSCRNAPRTLDLDLLMAGSLVHRGPRLLLPHPRFVLRTFALVPAAELAPDWLHPLVHQALGRLANEVLHADPACTPGRSAYHTMV